MSFAAMPQDDNHNQGRQPEPTAIPLEVSTPQGSFRAPDLRKRPFRWRPWLKGLGKGLLVAMVIMLGLDAIQHYRATAALDKALAEMDRTDPGWRLAEIEAARAVVPDDENGAVCIVEAASQLSDSWPNKDLLSNLEKLQPHERPEPKLYAELRTSLQSVGGALKSARKLADRPRGRHRITYLRNPLTIKLNDQQKARQVTDLLVLEALRCGEAGDTAGAVLACRAALNAARSIGDEPFQVSQLIRIACAIKACRAVERLLAHAEVSEEDLARLQHAFEEEAKNPDLLIGVRGDRAMVHGLFDAIESGDVFLTQALADRPTSPGFAEEYLPWRVRDFVRKEHVLMLSLATRRIDDVKMAPHDQIEAEMAFLADLDALPATSFLAKLFLKAPVKIGDAFRRKLAHVCCVAGALAVERYRRARGKWPESLDELTPAPLAEVPLDPFDGAAVRYRRLQDGVVVYSVSTDRVDDGGTLDREQPIRPGTDIVCRLWDVAQRQHRQAPAAHK
jgi:hypothetical protein